MKTKSLVAVLAGGMAFSAAASAQDLNNCNVIKDQSGNVAIFADRVDETVTTIESIKFKLGPKVLLKLTGIVLEESDTPLRVYAPIEVYGPNTVEVRASKKVEVSVNGVIQTCDYWQHQINTVTGEVIGYTKAYPTGTYHYPTCPDCVVFALCFAMPTIYGVGGHEPFCPASAPAHDEEIIHNAMYGR